jgi:hypothetical protein
MAINIPILTEFSDSGIKAAKAAFGNFKTAVGDAEGGMGKFRAGSKVALDAVQANAGLFAIAAGASVGKFVLDGINAFKDLALEADKYATATGLSIEDASRWIEHAGDIGVPIDAVATAVEKMNIAVGKNPDQFKELGIDLAYTNTGALDVNASFLNTIQHLKDIKDPAQRAKEGVKLLGRGWTDISRLIEEGSTTISDSLASVSEAKVISPEELKKAKEYRDAMNDLGDKIEDVKIKTGETAIPILTTLTNIAGYLLDAKALYDSFINGAASAVKDVASTISEGVSDIWRGFFGDGEDPIPVYSQEMRDARADTDTLKDSIKQARVDAIMPFKDKVVEATTALINADTAWKNLTTSLDEAVALDDAKTKLDELEAAAALAFGTGAQADIDDYEAKLATYAGVLAGISGTMDGISSKEILFKFRTEGPAAALAYANYLAKGAEYGGLSSFDALTLAGISGGFRASGGPVSSGSSYIVGEKGPELFTPTSSGSITPNNALGGGGNTINITVTSADPNAVVRALQSYNRNVGRLPVTVQ